MSQGNVATLTPVTDAASSRAIASLPRVKPRSLLTAVVGWERGRREAGEDLLASFAENYWGALCDPSSRAYPVVLQHYTTYVDPKARALVRAGDAQPMGAMPRIIIQGPQSAGAQDVAYRTVDVSPAVQSESGATVREDVAIGDARIIEHAQGEPTQAEYAASLTRVQASCATERAETEASAIGELRAQVAALTASVAQLASIVAASQRGAS